jgi:endo-1,4-beta-xylanase
MSMTRCCRAMLAALLAAAFISRPVVAAPARGAAGADEAGEAALARAAQNIAALRQGDAALVVFDQFGRPAPDVRLEVRQVSHAFKFGCHLYLEGLQPAEEQVYKTHFAGLFNYATFGVYWRFVEPERWAADWREAEREVEWAAGQGLRVKGHPLVWGVSWAGTPDWLPSDPDELWPLLWERVYGTVSRYRGRVHAWDVVNEPLEGGWFADALGHGYIKSAFGWARAADPDAELVVNEYGILSADSYKRDAYFALLAEMIKDGVEFDAVGIQAHEPRTEWFHPAIVAATLDRFAALGKPIHITEFGVQTDATAVTGRYLSGPWDAERQAAYFRQFYTVCFGHPQVEAITAWEFDDARAWMPGGGLLDGSWARKPAYDALARLLHEEWRTALTATTGAGGRAAFRGFYGDYELEAVFADGSRTTRRFTLARGGAPEWQVWQ